MSRKFFIALSFLAIGAFFALGRDQGSTTEKATPVPSNIHRIEDLTASQIDAFNRDRTLFILPVGTLEEHGPHLPISMDSFSVQFRVAAPAFPISYRRTRPLLRINNRSLEREREFETKLEHWLTQTKETIMRTATHTAVHSNSFNRDLRELVVRRICL
jgi:Creatinine amidohydrolase